MDLPHIHVSIPITMLQCIESGSRDLERELLKNPFEINVRDLRN